MHLTEIVGIFVAEHHAKRQLFLRVIFVKMHLLGVADGDIPFGKFVRSTIDVGFGFTVYHVNDFDTVMVVRYVQQKGFFFEE